MVENQVFQLFDLFADLPRNAKSALYSLSLFNFNFLLDQKKKKKKNFLGLGFQFVVVVVVVVFLVIYVFWCRVELQRDKHLEYLTKGLKRLDPSFCVLDAKYLSISISLAHMRIFIITNLNGVHYELILNYVTLCLNKSYI